MKRTTFQVVVNATTKHFVKGGGQSSADVNGNLPIQFTPLAGQMPSRATVISGTIAQTLGITEGNCYVLQVTFRDTNEYGDNYNVQNLGKLQVTDLAKLNEFKASFGQPAVVTNDAEVEVPAGVLNGEN
jgi:hypothetical protein